MIDVRKYLTDKQFADFLVYQAEKAEHWCNGTHRWLRIARAHRENITKAEIEYALANRISEDEKAEDAIMRAVGEKYKKTVDVEHCVPHKKPFGENGCGIMHPSPHFIWELMQGGIHPPIEAEWDVKHLVIARDTGKHAVVDSLEFPEWVAENGSCYDIIVDYRRIHNETQESLTYEQAIEYTVQKVLPHAIWGVRHNTPQLCIVHRDCMPTSRVFRDAWELDQEAIVRAMESNHQLKTG